MPQCRQNLFNKKFKSKSNHFKIFRENQNQNQSRDFNHIQKLNALVLFDREYIKIFL